MALKNYETRLYDSALAFDMLARKQSESIPNLPVPSAFCQSQLKQRLGEKALASGFLLSPITGSLL